MGQQLLYVVEHEGVEFVGANASFGAAALFAAGTPGVAVRAQVVTRRRRAAVSPMADELDSAGRAAQQPAEQEGVGLGMTRTVDAVVTCFGLGGFEGVLVDDGRDGDLDPLVAWPHGLAVPAQGRVVAGVGAVPIQSPDVGLVAEQSADGGQSPHCFALGRGDSFGGEGHGEVS